jgi:multiple sugar transport system permease protein
MIRGDNSTRDRLRTILLMLGGLLVALYVLLPFSWLVLTSFMHEQDALSVPPQWIPQRPTLSNYLTFFDPSGTRAVVGSRAAEQTLPSMWNSLVAASGTAALNVIFGALAGYSLARITFRGRGTLLALYLGSRMLPGIALIVPLYLTVRTYGLLDHIAALIITYLTFTLPFTIWLLKNYFQAIPRSLEEAALVDGCNWGQGKHDVVFVFAAMEECANVAAAVHHRACQVYGSGSLDIFGHRSLQTLVRGAVALFVGIYPGRRAIQA